MYDTRQDGDGDDTDVLPFAGRTGHPRYFAFIPGSGTWPGALGDFIAGVSNIENSSWLDSAGPSQPELVVLDWFKEWVGYPLRRPASWLAAARPPT